MIELPFKAAVDLDSCGWMPLREECTQADVYTFLDYDENGESQGVCFGCKHDEACKRAYGLGASDMMKAVGK